MLQTAGIHHITAIVSDPQINYDFYSKVLGLKLIKKTINFDRPEVYHLYFGNSKADPGTIITFFPWTKLAKGRIGTKQVGVTSFVIPIGTREFWENRLRQKEIPFKTNIRFNEKYIQFQDPDGLNMELVERDVDGVGSPTTDEIKEEQAIRGFAGTVLFSTNPEKTREVLETILGMEFVGQDESYIRLKTKASLGNTVDIKLSHPVRGLAGAGTVHHVAWRAKDSEELKQYKDLLEEKGYEPTEIKDRNYFKALYFTEDGEIFFEIATDPPGFTVDEEVDQLGKKLMLPSWYESRRSEFESILPKIKE